MSRGWIDDDDTMAPCPDCGRMDCAGATEDGEEGEGPCDWLVPCPRCGETECAGAGVIPSSEDEPVFEDDCDADEEA